MNNRKFSWGPWHGGYAVYDPPCGDYYSKPSQPKYQHVEYDETARKAAEIIARDRAAIDARINEKMPTSIFDAHEAERARVRHEGNLIRQAHAEPFCRQYYFWLGQGAEETLW